MYTSEKEDWSATELQRYREDDLAYIEKGCRNLQLQELFVFGTCHPLKAN